jgi:hypothetical protein
MEIVQFKFIRCDVDSYYHIYKQKIFLGVYRLLSDFKIPVLFLEVNWVMHVYTFHTARKSGVKSGLQVCRRHPVAKGTLDPWFGSRHGVMFLLCRYKCSTLNPGNVCWVCRCQPTGRKMYFFFYFLGGGWDAGDNKKVWSVFNQIYLHEVFMTIMVLKLNERQTYWKLVARSAIASVIIISVK